MAKDNDIQSKINLGIDTPILIAVAWPYVNGDLHVGHVAGYLLPSDIFGKLNRLIGRPVLMISGSDCYGTPIMVAADKEGKTPQQIVDEYHPKILELIKALNVDYELYTKTTTENHHKVTQGLFIDLANNGYITKKVTPQYYSEEENKFLPDRYVEGKCPNCGFEPARADQCDNCGTVLSEGQLLNPHSKTSGSPVIFKDTEHYFLDLSKLQIELEAYIKDKNYWREWVLGETNGWLKKGLIGRSITRDLDWGIEIPVDEIPNNLFIDGIENKRFYVWFDAVIGYLSASIEWSKLHKKDNDTPKWLNWEYYWKNDDAKHYYFMGKDNLFFHTIHWPAILLGSKKGYNLPYFPAINNFLNLEGQKFSKSRGIVLYPQYIIDNYGIDILRFYLSSIMPENHDADWSWKEFVAVNNNELVANFGNFIHRVLTFYKANEALSFEKHKVLAVENIVEEEIKETFIDAQKLIEECRFSEALERILKLSSFGNKYLNDNEPWKLIKTDVFSATEAIYNCFTIINNLRILMYPYLPSAMDKLTRMLGYPNVIVSEIGKNQWKYTPWDSNQKIEEFIEPLFRKFDEKEVLERELKLN